MAACMKKQRVNDDCKDRIGNLPDCPIHCILSFLSTKYAVRTTLLSKRWIDMWMFVSNLHFDYNSDSPSLDIGNAIAFGGFVTRVLLHHSNPTLQSFTFVAPSLSFGSNYGDAWLSAALCRQVQKLHFAYEESIKISPRPLFQCQSLVDLKLKLRCGTLRFRAFVCLPNLKFLSLSGISLLSGSSAHPKELTLSFLVLRVFKLEHCLWVGSALDVCLLQVPLLEVFSVANMDTFMTTKIFSSCPKIFSFKIEDSKYCQHFYDIVLSDPSLASEATFEISGSVKSCYPVCKLIRRFHQMRCLRLDIEIPIQATGDFKNLPEFSNVCQLQLGKASSEFLLVLLHKLPILETLVLDSVSPESFSNMRLDFATVPYCLVSSLKTVKMGLLLGEWHEVSLAKFLMEKGAVMEKMTLCLSKLMLQNGSLGITNEVIKGLLLSNRKSSCSLEFMTV